MLENVFSWSKSRDEEFRECKRKYYYARYQSWGGWEKSAPEKVRLAYILKNLKNRYAWKGESVHHIVEESMKSLRSGKPMPLEMALESLTQTMRVNYLSSKNKKHYEDPKRNLGLFEHEYQKPISDIMWKELHDSSAECVRNFYRSDLYQELLKDDKHAWLVIEDLEEFPYDKSKIYVKLDFARAKDGFVEIYDWKTGKSESKDAWIQIGAYTIYAMGKWKVPLDRVRAYLFNLTAVYPTPNSQEINAEMMERSRVFISASIASMKEMLVDPVRNIPKPEKEFPFTTNERLCENCAFKKICEKFNS